jgi:hypothetical protein
MPSRGKRRNDHIAELRPGTSPSRERDREFESHSLQRGVSNEPLKWIWPSIKTSDIAKVQEWLGRANTATTRIYDTARPGPRTARPSTVAY